MNRIPLVLLLLAAPAALSGCSLFGGKAQFDIADGECSTDPAPWTWARDLSHHVLKGGGGGSFDYDPDGQSIDDISGFYDLATGDFEWDVTYSDDHYLTGTHVEGFGTIYENGDMDLVGTSTTTDIREDESRVLWRLVRDGCEVDLKEVYVDEDGVELYRNDTDGAYDTDGFVFVLTMDVDGDPYEVDGLRTPDLTRTIDADYEIGGVSNTLEETYDEKNEFTETEWTQAYDDAGTDMYYEGHDEFDRQGDFYRSYSVEQNGSHLADSEYFIDYFGDGTGTWTFYNGDVCDLEYDGFVCTYDCGGGNVGSCS